MPSRLQSYTQKLSLEKTNKQTKYFYEVKSNKQNTALESKHKRTLSTAEDYQLREPGRTEVQSWHIVTTVVLNILSQSTAATEFKTDGNEICIVFISPMAKCRKGIHPSQCRNLADFTLISDHSQQQH